MSPAKSIKNLHASHKQAFTAPETSRPQPVLSSQTIQRAVTSPSQLHSDDILALQRTCGNRAVARMLQQAQPSVMPTTIGVTSANTNTQVPPAIMRTHDRYIQRGILSRFRRNKGGKGNPGSQNSESQQNENQESESQEVQGEQTGTNQDGNNVEVQDQNQIPHADKYTLTLAVQNSEENFLSKSMLYTMKRKPQKYMKVKALQKAFGLDKDLIAPSGTGHSWVELRAYNEGKLTFGDSYGFTPSGFSHPDFHAGLFGEDVIYKDYPISRENMLNVVKKAKKIQEADPEYSLSGYNCTRFARDMVRAAGLKFVGRRVIPGMPVGIFGSNSFTPSRLFKALEKEKDQGSNGSYELFKRRDNKLGATEAELLGDVDEEGNKVSEEEAKERLLRHQAQREEFERNRLRIDQTAIRYMKEGEWDLALDYTDKEELEGLNEAQLKTLAAILNISVEELQAKIKAL